MNVLILCAGSSRREDMYPNYLTEHIGKPILQISIEKLSKLNSNIHVLLNEVDIKKYYLDGIVRELNPNIKIIRISHPTHGAACTALMAIELINNNEELIILNGDEVIDIEFKNPLEIFRQPGNDAGVIIFDSIHPRYSYVRLDSHNHVIEAAEKRPISKNATAGFYWYRSGKIFVNAAMNSIRKQALLETPYFICPVFNELILENKIISTFRINEYEYKPFKSPEHFINLNKQ